MCDRIEMVTHQNTHMPHKQTYGTFYMESDTKASHSFFFFFIQTALYSHHFFSDPDFFFVRCDVSKKGFFSIWILEKFNFLVAYKFLFWNNHWYITVLKYIHWFMFMPTYQFEYNINTKWCVKLNYRQINTSTYMNAD